ncbi:MAG: hypothetical protein K6B68_04445 [Eubacterium sp.]|nr:hypothetical protein [Eubacterium sp.]
MEKYIEEMNNIHAPEALILKTLARVHEEEQKVNEEKSESGIQENQITGTEYREAINKDNVNNVIEFVPSEDTKKRNRKELIRKFIIGGSTVAAAAVVLIIALNVRNLNSHNYSSESSDYSDSAATEAAVADEAEESYEDSYVAEDTESFDGVSSGADKSDDSYMAESSAAAEESETAEAADDISGKYYNEIDDSSKTLNANDDATAAGDSEGTDSDRATYGEETYDIKGKIDGLDGNIIGGESVSLSEYSTYIGVDLEKTFELLAYDETYFQVVTGDDGQELTDDLGRILLNVEDGTAIVQISKNRTIAPEQLLNGTPSYISDKMVYIGKSKLSESYYAAFEMNGVNFYLKMTDTTKAAFEDIISRVIR